MTHRLVWAASARSDLLEIARYIGSDDTDAARRWIRRLRARALSAAERPLSGRVVPEFKRGTIREVIERTYRIVYRVERARIVVLHLANRID
jgi:plasmid stabilization system protein ParE